MYKWIYITKQELGLLIRDCKDDKLKQKLLRYAKGTQPSTAKSKGRGLQHWVCEKLSELLDVPFNNQDDQCLIHSREMGQAGVDVILRGEAREKFPFAIECKNTENLNLVSAINQARFAKHSENKKWILVHKRKALSEAVVITSWTVFSDVYRDYLKLKEQVKCEKSPSAVK